MKAKVKSLFSDSIWSIAGIVLMNAVAQLVVYPQWNKALGNEEYGNILYMLSLMNIAAASMGTACNYSRMKQSAAGQTRNSAYTCMLLASSGVILVLTGILACGSSAEPVALLLFALLSIGTMWRFYADVEFRLRLNYKRYFIYYAIISAGYAAGAAVFHVTGRWAVSLLLGEVAGLAYVLLRGTIFRRDRLDRRQLADVAKMVVTLYLTNVLSNVIFNGDRLLLRNILNGEAVTIFYQASLLGKTIAMVSTPLNGVIIGYLARYKGRFTPKAMHLISAAAVAVIIVGTLGCTVFSHLFIRLIYPQNYQMVKAYFLIANMSQIMYFTTNMVTVVLLRFTRTRYQMYINVVYAAAFVALCIPAAIILGLPGFSWALLATNAIRLAAALALGYYGAAGRADAA